MSRRPAIDHDVMVWRAREAAVALVTASLEGAMANDPSRPSAALRAARDGVPAAQRDEFGDALLLAFSELVGAALSVTAQTAGLGGDGSVEAITAGALAVWRDTLVPLILDGAPACDDLAAVGETLTAEMEAWLRQQQRPEDGSCPD